MGRNILVKLKFFCLLAVFKGYAYPLVVCIQNLRNVDPIHSFGKYRGVLFV